MPPSPWIGSSRSRKLGGEFCFEIGDVVETDELDAGHNGVEGLAILVLAVAATEPMVRPWKLFSRARNFMPRGLPSAHQAGIRAGELEGGFLGLGAAVAEEGAVHAGDSVSRRASAA